MSGNTRNTAIPHLKIGEITRSELLAPVSKFLLEVEVAENVLDRFNRGIGDTDRLPPRTLYFLNEHIQG